MGVEPTAYMGIWLGMYNRLPSPIRRAVYPLELKIRANRHRRLDNIVHCSMAQVLEAVSAKEPAMAISVRSPLRRSTSASRAVTRSDVRLAASASGLIALLESRFVDSTGK